jgi:hypothetical protein
MPFRVSRVQVRGARLVYILTTNMTDRNLVLQGTHVQLETLADGYQSNRWPESPGKIQLNKSMKAHIFQRMRPINGV